MMFKIILSSSSEKFIRNSDKELRNRLLDKINKLMVDPIPRDAKRILGRDENIFRVRVGDYRILYVIYFEEKTILISDIDKRERVYLK